MQPKSQLRYRVPDRFGGLTAMMLGIIALIEAYRKYPFRVSAFVGDHIMLTVVGVLLIVLGLATSLFAQPSQPQPLTNRRTLFTTIALLFLYALLLPTLGYLLSTFLIAIGLFRVIGTYRIHISLINALLLTAALNGLFILLLGMSFPTGILGW